MNGKHGRWYRESWEVPDGTMLKFFTACIWMGQACSHGTVCCLVDASTPRIRITGHACCGRSGMLQGPLRIIRPQEYRVRDSRPQLH